jgi:UDP-N-acetyl-D-mannosaminuronic acid transferase (WecB/TagA/CpsF family)
LLSLKHVAKGTSLIIAPDPPPGTTVMQITKSVLDPPRFRKILGVRFFTGPANKAVSLGARPGLVVVPAAPALVELTRDPGYRQALLESDLAITDSGFLVLLWNIMTFEGIRRVSGLEYLKLLLERPEFQEVGSSFWIMPSQRSLHRNLNWLQKQGFPIREEDCYVAPSYESSCVADKELACLIDERKPRHVIVGLGGGTQEKLGLYLKTSCRARPSFHCIGAAIGFLSGDQIRIPDWADRFFLGWLFRCASKPSRFIPRYVRALRLPLLLLRNWDRMPQSLGESAPVRTG